MKTKTNIQAYAVKSDDGKKPEFLISGRLIKREATKNQKEPISKKAVTKLAAEKPKCPTIQHLTLSVKWKNQRDPNPVEKI